MLLKPTIKMWRDRLTIKRGRASNEKFSGERNWGHVIVGMAVVFGVLYGVGAALGFKNPIKFRMYSFGANVEREYIDVKADEMDTPAMRACFVGQVKTLLADKDKQGVIAKNNDIYLIAKSCKTTGGLTQSDMIRDLK